MARPDPTSLPCPHVLDAPLPFAWPFSIAMVLDEQLGVTDALVRCDTCERIHLLEMVSWPDDDPNVRTFRCAIVDADSWARLTKLFDQTLR